MTTCSAFASPALANLDFHVTFTPELLRKDIDLGLSAGREFGVPLPLASVVRDLVQTLIGHGMDEEDFAKLIVLQARAAGIELVPEGGLTPKLWDLKLGSNILIRRRIVGQFVLDTTVSRHLMLATVTGVAPFISILRTQEIERADGAKLEDRFLVIHGASRSADFGPYLRELKELSLSGWLTYVPTISRPWEESNWTGETGRIEDIVRKHIDQLGFDHTRTVAYACGHPGMVENVKGLLARASFPQEQIKEEEYFKLHDAHPAERQRLPINQKLRSVATPNRL